MYGEHGSTMRSDAGFNGLFAGVYGLFEVLLYIARSVLPKNHRNATVEQSRVTKEVTGQT